MTDPTLMFISYAKPDESWAERLAQRLDEAGYETQLAEINVESSASSRLAQALQLADYVVVLFSPNYMTLMDGDSGWKAVADDDRIIPVRVQSFGSPAALLTGRYIDLAGEQWPEAAPMLLEKIRQYIDGSERHKHRASGSSQDLFIETVQQSQPVPRLTSDTWTVVDRLGFDIYVNAITSFPAIQTLGRLLPSVLRANGGPARLR